MSSSHRHIGILYVVPERERETSVTLLLLFFNNGLVGKQQRATTKQHFFKKTQQILYVSKFCLTSVSQIFSL